MKVTEEATSLAVFTHEGKQHS